MYKRLLIFAALIFPSQYSAFADESVRITTEYSLTRDARVSLNIYDAGGQVVRELLHAAPRKKGANAEIWDGLDEQGKPAAAGKYTWKLLSTQGLKAEYLMTLGTNPTLAWATWPGNHLGVSAVAVDQDGAYFSGGTGESTPVLVKQTLDGQKRLWDIPGWLDAWSGGVAMDSMNGKIWMFNGGQVWRIDAATGKPEVKLETRWEDKDETAPPPLDWASRNLDMAAGQDQLVLSYTAHNAIRWYDADGKKLDEANVSAPLGITVAPDGGVLVISKDTVVQITRENKTPRAVITNGLSGAYRLRVDSTNGDILVAERGGDNQVKRFSGKGKLLRAYGKKGGRPMNGVYDPLGFNSICDIAADGLGGFFMVEDTAPRILIKAENSCANGTAVNFMPISAQLILPIQPMCGWTRSGEH